MKLSIIAVLLVVLAAQSADAWGWYRPYGYGSNRWGYNNWGYNRYNRWNRWSYWRRSTSETPNEARLMKEMPTDLMNRTECVYTNDSNILSCHGPSGVVECETELTWEYPVQFELFGLSPCENHTDAYRVMPRKLDNTVWMDNKLVVEGVEKRVMLHGSEEYKEEMGLRVLEKKCWDRMSTLFKKSLRSEKVWYTTGEDMETTRLIADLMVSDETPDFLNEEEEDKEGQDGKTKRWYWSNPYGLGYYGRYYSGLYGLGYPYYSSLYSYYGKRSAMPAVRTDNLMTEKRNMDMDMEV